MQSNKKLLNICIISSKTDTGKSRKQALQSSTLHGLPPPRVVLPLATPPLSSILLCCNHEMELNVYIIHRRIKRVYRMELLGADAIILASRTKRELSD